MNHTLALLLIALNRIADELHQSNVLATLSTPAPGVELPFDAYAEFDPAAIGARGVAKDKSGWTEIEWGMRTFYRRRSGEDDEKGEAIRFTRCTGGTAAEKNQTWETLVRFRDRRGAKKLTSDQAERLAAHKAATQQQQSVSAGPATGPATRPVAETTPFAPTRPPPPADPLTRWRAARKDIIGEIPHWLELIEGESPEAIAAKADALDKIIAAHGADLAALSDAGAHHQAAVSKANQYRIEIGTGLSMLLPSATADEVDAATTTINNIIQAEFRKRAASHAPAVTQSGTAAPEISASDGAPPGARSPEKLREWILAGAKSNAGQARAASAATRQSVWLALRAACNGDETNLQAVIAALFGVARYSDATSASVYALQAWLRPTTQNKPSYPHAAAEVTALLDAAREVQPA